ncbi:NADH-quinone oxidoreductase subunit N [bacterium HR36]|nr:NADH-quinone oxidoreductase subunit N [bacterium HR36]
MEKMYETLTTCWKLVLPELVLLGTAAVMILGSLYTQRRGWWASLSLAALVISGWLWLLQDTQALRSDWILSASLFAGETWRWLLRGLVLGAGMLLVPILWKQVIPEKAAEFFACFLSIMAGVGTIVASNDLVSLFLGLELVSIPTYIALYILRRDNKGLEAAIKYFLLSIFSSAIFLFGVSLLYLVAGRTNYQLLRMQLLVVGANPLLVVSGVLILGGLGFRVAAVPFHFYAPDVFAGAHPVAAAMLAVLPKMAGLVAMYQILVEIYSAALGPPGNITSVLPLLLLTLAILSGATMLLGNVVGLLQEEIYRLLAYSSIAHAGYMLLGLAAGTQGKPVSGDEALVFYLGTYVIMSLGVFAGLLCVRQDGKLLAYIDELSGLARSRPLLAFCLAVNLLSLTGLPPTAGFWGKVMLFLAAWYAPEGQKTLRYLAVFLAINAAIGAWYYLRLLGVMYLRQPLRPFDAIKDRPAWMACLVCTLLTLVLFFVPNLWWRPIAWAFSSHGLSQ